MFEFRRVASVLLAGSVFASGCSEQSRVAPTSPSGSVLTGQSTSWACGQIVDESRSTNGWSFLVPALNCGVQPWLSDLAGDGIVTTAPANLRVTVTGTTVRLDWTGVPAGAISFLVEAGSATTLANLGRFNTGNAATFLVVNDVPAGVYYVRLRGVGPDGLAGPASNEVTVRVGGPCSGPPGAPALNATVGVVK